MEEPSSSNQTYNNTFNNFDDLQLNVNDEEAEIANLKLSTSNNTAVERFESESDDRIPKIEFQCSFCSMMEMVHYYGKVPPFLYGLRILEDSFVIRDPFQPPPMRWKPKPEYFVVIGAKCYVCQNIVCKGIECSFYYTHTYCLNCAEANINNFPLEAKAKLRKQLAKK